MQQKTTEYKDVVEDIKKFFKQKLKQIDKVRIPQNKIWFDPGIGFGKNLKQNLLILKI
jgi:dihydropteroate synthase